MRPCWYCYRPIMMDEPGWGYYIEEKDLIYFHTECMEEYEMVAVW